MDFSFGFNKPTVELPTPAYAVGQKVMTRKMGVIAIGEIVGMELGSLYFARTYSGEYIYHPWSNQYPYWIDQYTYTLYYEEAHQNIPLDAYLVMAGYDKTMDKSGEVYSFLKERYSYLPKNHYLVFPEDDLEIYED